MKPKPKPPYRLRSLQLGCGLLLAAVQTTQAATTGFNQTAAGPWDYNTAANWASSTINGLWDSSLTLGANQTVTFATDTVLTTGLTFDYAGNYALALQASAAGTKTITLGGNVSLNTGGGSAANVTIGNATNHLNVNLGGVTRTMTVAADRTLTLVDVVSNGGITKDGAGTLALSGVNTFAGQLTLSSGTLKASGSISALGTGAATLQLNGGTLDFAHTGALNFARNTTVGGNVTMISEKSTAGVGVKYTLGTLSIGGHQVDVQGGNVSSGTAELIFGATTLTGNATFNITKPTAGGSTKLTLGAASGAHSLTLTGDGDFAQSADFLASGLSLVFGVNGGTAYSGTATLNRGNNFTGGLTLNSGKVVTTANGAALGKGAVNLNGGILNLTGNASGNNFGASITTTTVGGNATILNEKHALGVGQTVTFNALSIGANTLTVQGGSPVISGTAGVSYAGVTLTGAATFNVDNLTTGATTLLTLARTGTDTVDNGGHLMTVDGGGNTTVTGAISGAGGLTKKGGGTLTLNGASDYSGATNVNGGTLAIGTTGTINSTSSVSIGAGEFSYNNSTTALSKGISFSGSTGTLSGTGTITPAVTITSGNRQTAGSSVTSTNATASVGKETFSTGITYHEGSIFEWNLNADNGVGLGTRGTDYDAVDTGALATTGTKAIFRVILNGTDNFDETFWDSDRTWNNIFTDGSNALNIADIFKSTVEFYNSAGVVANGNTTGRSFSISGTDLSWSAVPEPTSALAGLLIGAGLLRRRRG